MLETIITSNYTDEWLLVWKYALYKSGLINDMTVYVTCVLLC
jgi:hypothetical protein